MQRIDRVIYWLIFYIWRRNFDYAALVECSGSVYLMIQEIICAQFPLEYVSFITCHF